MKFKMLVISIAFILFILGVIINEQFTTMSVTLMLGAVGLILYVAFIESTEKYKDE